MKKMLSLLLVFMLVLFTVTSAFAAEGIEAANSRKSQNSKQLSGFLRWKNWK